MLVVHRGCQTESGSYVKPTAKRAIRATSSTTMNKADV